MSSLISMQRFIARNHNPRKRSAVLRGKAVCSKFNFKKLQNIQYIRRNSTEKSGKKLFVFLRETQNFARFLSNYFHQVNFHSRKVAQKVIATISRRWNKPGRSHRASRAFNIKILQFLASFWYVLVFRTHDFPNFHKMKYNSDAFRSGQNPGFGLKKERSI